MIIKQLSIAWEKVTGNPDTVPLEHRVFNAINLLSGIFLLITLPFNLYAGLYRVCLLFVAAIALVCYLYYLARYKGNYTTSSFIYAISCLVLLVSSYIMNDGINGPTFLGFFVTLQMIAAVKPRKKFGMWWLLHIAIAGGLLLFEYDNPGQINHAYINKGMRLSDMFFTYCLTSLLIFFIIYYLRANYHRERILAEKHALDIEKKNRDLELVNLEKNKLFSIVSHDMRSPLASIQSALELLSTDEIEEEDRKAIKKELLWLTGNTSDMLNNLLLWSKSQLDQMTVKLAPIELGRALQETLTLQSKIAEKKGITLSHEIDPALKVMADIDMLQLVVRNLVNNAIKFTNTNGHVAVKAFADGSRCKIEVIDNGKGIPEDMQEEIFKPKHEATYGTMNEKGVGLGLVLCKEFTERQKGSIGFTSQVNVGTTFYITLPLA
ncbi:MAG: HAMP domain-containing histidine kinase [Sphingobacteriales bacterium]|nr:MAG: HAMP domain-containing histidine kinase [Sphingobacteriales bacterium]